MQGVLFVLVATFLLCVAGSAGPEDEKKLPKTLPEHLAERIKKLRSMAPLRRGMTRNFCTRANLENMEWEDEGFMCARPWPLLDSKYSLYEIPQGMKFYRGEESSEVRKHLPPATANQKKKFYSTFELAKDYSMSKSFHQGKDEKGEDRTNTVFPIETYSTKHPFTVIDITRLTTAMRLREELEAVNGVPPNAEKKFLLCLSYQPNGEWNEHLEQLMS